MELNATAKRYKKNRKWKCVVSWKQNKTNKLRQILRELKYK